MQFEPVAPGGILTVPASPGLDAAVEELKRRWEAATSGPHAFATSALAFHDAPSPLLPGWGWPMADPEDPTPVYDELVQTMPDPTGTDASAEEVAGDGVADPAGADES